MRKKTNRIILTNVILAMTVFSCQNKPQIEDNRTDNIGKLVDEYLEPLIKNDLFNGVILIAKEGKIVLNKAYGYANYEHQVRNTPETKFRIASLSKPFTKLAIIQLLEKNALNLDDVLSKFIPNYPQGDIITIQHLLDHSSGIPHLNDFDGYDEFAKEQYSVKQVIDLFKNELLEYEPGTKKTYSNSGYALLVYIIEKTSGLSYENYLDRNIFQPAGMKNSGDDSGKHIVSGLAKGYMMNLENKGLQLPLYYNPSTKIGGGSLYSTTEDLFLFSKAYKEGRLSKSTEPLYDQGTFGKSPGYNSMIWGLDKVDIVLLSNNYSTPIKSMFFSLSNMVRDKEYKIVEIEEDITIKIDNLSEYEGDYKIGNDIETIELVNNVLIEYENGYKWQGYRIIPLGKDKFYDTFYMEKLTFTRDEKGVVNGFEWESGDKTILVNKKAFEIKKSN